MFYVLRSICLMGDENQQPEEEEEDASSPSVFIVFAPLILFLLLLLLLLALDVVKEVVISHPNNPIPNKFKCNLLDDYWRNMNGKHERN